MPISGPDGTWEYDRYQREIQEHQYKYISLKELRNFVVPDNSGPAIEDPDFPYPALQINEELDLHLLPRDDHLVAFVVERSSDRPIGSGRENPGFWFDDADLREFTGYMVDSIKNHMGEKFNLSSNFKADLRETLTSSKLLQDPFNPELWEKLRPPTVRWLRQRTANVSVHRAEYTGGAYVKTEWEVDLAPESLNQEGIRTISKLRMKDVLQPSARKIQNEYHRTFHTHIYLSDSWWFDISNYWINESLIRDYAEDDIPDSAPSDFVLRPSETGKFHLATKKSGESYCSTGPNLGEKSDFDINSLPIPPMLCNHCSHMVKQLVFKQKILE